MIYDSRIQTLMAAPAMDSTFALPYERSAVERTPLPVPLGPKKMTYDEAYEEASLACWELMGNPHGGRDWEDLHEKLLDALCIKHDIE